MTIDLKIMPPEGWMIQGASMKDDGVTIRLRKKDRPLRTTNCQNCGQVVRVWDEHAVYRDMGEGKLKQEWSC